MDARTLLREKIQAEAVERVRGTDRSGARLISRERAVQLLQNKIESYGGEHADHPMPQVSDIDPKQYLEGVGLKGPTPARLDPEPEEPFPF